jgi:hypothetical protein
LGYGLDERSSVFSLGQPISGHSSHSGRIMGNPRRV